MQPKQNFCTECGKYCDVKPNGKSQCCNALVGKKS